MKTEYKRFDATLIKNKNMDKFAKGLSSKGRKAENNPIRTAPNITGTTAETRKRDEARCRLKARSYPGGDYSTSRWCFTSSVASAPLLPHTHPHLIVTD